MDLQAHELYVHLMCVWCRLNLHSYSMSHFKFINELSYNFMDVAIFSPLNYIFRRLIHITLVLHFFRYIKKLI
jgi:hypothetical protein